MDSSELIFKGLSVLHAAGGYLLVVVASDERVQEQCLYQGRNPLVGDIKKYLVLIGAWCLIACGIIGVGLFVIEAPRAAIALAWISLALFLATSVVDLIAQRRWPRLCKSCAINFMVRFAAALALTLTFYRDAHG